MNFFDIAILLFTLELIFNKFISEKVFLYSLYLAVITSLAQIFTVGYKWQYMPIYLIIFFYAIKYTSSFSLNNKLLRYSLFFIILIIYTISFLTNFYLPIPEFTIQDKEYSVSYEEIHIVLDDREQPIAFSELSNLEPSGKRELLVDIYYPSNDTTEPIQLFKNSPSNWGETVINYLNRTWGINLPTFLFSHLNLSYFDIGINLDPLPNKSPVIVYTHGWAGEKIFASDQLITLASKGYVVIALDHTGLAMFTELPSGTIYNTGGTEDSSKVFNVMLEMSIDIENTINYFMDNNNNYYYADFNDISIIGHSTGGGSAHLYCLYNNCSTVILQDPYFVPIVEELGSIDLNSETYFIYSEDWYQGYEDNEQLSEIEVYRNYVNNKNFARGYYLNDSAHYDFVAFGSISSLTKYTFLKGTIDYENSLTANNYFNLSAINRQDINETDFLTKINE